MRLGYIVLIAALICSNAVSGKLTLTQPQFPAARSTATALMTEGGGVAGQRALRSHDDTYDQGRLNVADTDDEERGINPVQWFKGLFGNHRKETVNFAKTDLIPVWKSMEYNDDRVRSALKELKVTDKKTVKAILKAYNNS